MIIILIIQYKIKLPRPYKSYCSYPLSVYLQSDNLSFHAANSPLFKFASPLGVLSSLVISSFMLFSPSLLLQKSLLESRAQLLLPEPSWENAAFCLLCCPLGSQSCKTEIVHGHFFLVLPHTNGGATLLSNSSTQIPSWPCHWCFPYTPPLAELGRGVGRCCTGKCALFCLLLFPFLVLFPGSLLTGMHQTSSWILFNKGQLPWMQSFNKMDSWGGNCASISNIDLKINLSLASYLWHEIDLCICLTLHYNH